MKRLEETDAGAGGPALRLRADVPPGVRLEVRGCPLECPGGDALVFTGRDLLHGMAGTFALVRCRGCGLMRTNPRPSADTIAYYYPEDYSPYLTTRVRPTAAVGPIRAGWWSLARVLFRTNGRRLPPMPPGRLLEIGCASGAYLAEMATAGWEVRGLEFSEAAASAARSLGYQVTTGQLEDAPDPTDRFDLIVGWHVLEHLHEPVACLRKLHGWLRPGGRLALSMPNAGSFEFRHFQARWRSTQLPIHLFHYTPASLAEVLEGSGWELLRVLYQRDLTDLLVSIGQELRERRALPALANFLLDVPTRAHPAFRHAVHPVACLMACLRQSGRITVWARRQGDP